MATLLALVTSALTGALRRAVSAEMSDFATVVALLTLGAIAAHVTIAAAGVACLSTLSATAAVAATVTTTTVASLGVTASLWAVTSDVADLSALVAFLRSTTSREATTTTSGRASALGRRVGAIAADVACLTTLVASLVFWSLWAFSAHMSFTTAVVALSRATGRAVTGLVRSIATVVAATGLGSTTVFHCESWFEIGKK